MIISYYVKLVAALALHKEIKVYLRIANPLEIDSPFILKYFALKAKAFGV